MKASQLRELASDLAAVRNEIKALTVKEAGLKEEINDFLNSKNVDAIQVLGVTVSRSWQERTNLDAKRVAIFLGAQIKDFQSVTRFSQIKIIGG